MTLRKSFILSLACAAVFAGSSSAQAAHEGTVATFEGQLISVGQLDDLLRDAMRTSNLPAVSLAILNDNRVVFHRALGVTDQDAPAAVDVATVFEAASLTKPVFSYFVMRMVEDGLLDLDRPLHEYVPFDQLWNGWYAGIAGDQRHRQITARTVLAHSTGLPNWRWEDDGEELTIHSDPGSTFSYSGEAYELLADVLAHSVRRRSEGTQRRLRTRRSSDA